MDDSSGLMSVQELVVASKGIVLCDFTHNARCSSVVTDSRAVQPGALFIPLIGEKQDGHVYISSALESGAKIIFVDTAHGEGSAGMFSQLAKQYGAAIIMVKNTLSALQDAARAYIQKFPTLMKIGITGSSGKTTTKELCLAIFSQKYQVIANEGNLNSETGLPLSVFRIRSTDQVGIFELGMNRRREMTEIARVLSPETALITNVGTAHIGILGSQQAIAEEKKEIFTFFSDASIGFVPEDDEYKDFLASNILGTILEFGPTATKGIVSVESNGLQGWTIQYEDQSIKFPMPGPYNLRNAYAAISLARQYAIEPALIKKGLESIRPLFGRTEILQGSVTAVFDYYNANPESMREAMDFCDSLPWDNEKIFILGSMLELGSGTLIAHRELCKMADRSSANHIFLFGEDIINAGKEIEWEHDSVYFMQTMEDLSAKLSEVLTPNALVFIKGSRGMALERLRPLLARGTAGVGLA